MKLVFKRQVARLFAQPAAALSTQVFRALFVGGVAFVADAGSLWAFSLAGLHYLVCALFGFILGVAVNFVLSVKIVFSARAKMGRAGELTVYLLVSLVGLGLTEGLLWLFTERIGLHFMLSKCVAAVIAFSWNFTARKLILYPKAKVG